jgi:probable selenium-dependent hydroxylase accessory protein YqeC
MFLSEICILRGGGDLATGVAYRLHQAGLPVIVLELARPMVVRRRVALATAVLEGEITVEGLTGRRVESLAEALELAHSSEVVPVLVAPELPAGDWSVVIDARVAKRNIDTRINQARLVIALGPGFTAGVDCHAVIETMRGHDLGRVIWQGAALPNTGTPGVIAGKAGERVLRAPAAGKVVWQRDIGDRVAENDLLGHVGDRPVAAPFAGVLRGLIAPGTPVPAGYKIGDLDARAEVSACFTISDKSLAIGGGVLAAILNRQRWRLARRARPRLSLRAAVGLEGPSGMVAIVGGGGKSSLMFALARELNDRVVSTTTTRIFAAQMKQAPTVCFFPDAPDLATDWLLLGRRLAQYGHCLVVGQVEGDKARGVGPTVPAQLLAHPAVDTVLIEADGSRMRPCKAPADHEPVIPPEADVVVAVAGIDAVGRPLDEVAHRPELAAALVGASADAVVTPEMLARLLTHPQGGQKNVPAGARFLLFINKVTSEAELELARQAARLALREPRVSQVVIGAVQSVRPVREIHRRVTAVILAAGESQRMGQTKQLMPWGDTTVLGQTIRNAQQSAAHDVVVVTGHEAPAVAALAAEKDAVTVHNPDYAAGEMLSSLQAAVRQLSGDRAAVLVMLADQPMVTAAILDQILVAYWQGESDLIAPEFDGRRGNPVLIGRRYFAELLTLPAGSAPRDLVRRYASDLHLVAVESDAVVQDIDRPENHERWRPG